MLDVDSPESFTSRKILSFEETERLILELKEKGKRVGL